MSLRLSALLLSAGLSLAVSPVSTAQDGGALLAEVMKRPGSWDQMCRLPAPVAFDVPVPVFSDGLVSRYFNLGPKETARLRAARPAVVAALVQQLSAMDLAKPPANAKEEVKPEDSSQVAGLKPDWLNAVHLQVIGSLNAVETLPALLRLEEQLSSLLDAAEKDSKALLPPLVLDSPVTFLKPGKEREKPAGDKFWESAEYKREMAVFSCRVMQRELLGTITLLLKNERWPAVAERFAAETKAAGAAAVAASEKAIAEAKARLEAKPDAGQVDYYRNGISYHQELIRRVQSGDVPLSLRVSYTPQLRADIRGLAESFLKSVPAEKRRAGAAVAEPEKPQ